MNKTEKVEKKGSNIIEEYIFRYPQLTLPIARGMSTTEEYKNIVLRGKFPAELPNLFQGTDEDCIFQIDTPVGMGEVVYLAYRQDFEDMVRRIAYKCENEAIPASMGAIHINGIINHRKIMAHKKAYLEEGNTDWRHEFKRFTADAENFKDTLMIVSKGNYSALPATDAGYSREEWLDISLSIRIYHELTHMVCKKQKSERVSVLKDEIVADSMGIYKALGYYDEVLAKKILGIEGDSYRKGGRLENYLDAGQDLQQCSSEAKEVIKKITHIMEKTKKLPFWETLETIERSQL